LNYLRDIVWKLNKEKKKIDGDGEFPEEKENKVNS